MRRAGDDALVDAFEAAGKQQRAGAGGELGGERLRQRLAARRQVDQRRIGFVGAGVIDGGGEHVGAHHHAGAAARRRVVDGAMAADAEVADGNGAQRPQAGLQRPADERDAERPGEHLREQRQHRCPPGRALTFAWEMRHSYSTQLSSSPCEAHVSASDVSP